MKCKEFIKAVCIWAQKHNICINIKQEESEITIRRVFIGNDYILKTMASIDNKKIGVFYLNEKECSKIPEDARNELTKIIVEYSETLHKEIV